MEDATRLVARNLRKIRTDQKLSLDQLAELSGVSKSMLGQIERGDSSPTIQTVWKIATGLKVSFSRFLAAGGSEACIVHKADIKPLVEDRGRYRLFPLFLMEEGRSFEIYTIEIGRGGHLSAEPHSAGTQEFITVTSGELTLTVGEDEYKVAEGDSIQFRADRPHAYRNSGKILTRLNLVINYSS